MICALLIFRTPELPAPLSQLSPWLDELVVPRDEAFAQLAAQEHRRFVKTHTPLHEMTIAPRATYIVVARHPLEPRVPGEPVAYRGRLCVARLSQTRCTSSPGGDGLVDCRQELLELHGPGAGGAVQRSPCRRRRWTAAACLFEAPCPQASMILARNASACYVFARRAVYRVPNWLRVCVAERAFVTESEQDAARQRLIRVRSPHPV